MPTFRPADETDLARLVELSRQLADHDIALGQRRPLRWSADPTATIAQALRNPTEHDITVVVDERGDVIGACHTSLMGDELNRPGIPGDSLPWKRGWSHGINEWAAA